MNLNWLDLETKGFLHIPALLSSSTIETLVSESFAGTKAANSNYSIKTVSPALREELHQSHFKKLAHDVCSNTGIYVDTTKVGVYFSIKDGVNFDWHQDHESWFQTQDHFNYLNIWIPIVKPDQKKSNLSIIPFDVLKSEIPDLYAKTVRNGASRIVEMQGKTFWVSDNEWDHVDLSKSASKLRSIAITPELAAGDALILRGDLFHRTHDTDTERISVSFRLLNSRAIVSRKKLLEMSPEKFLMLGNNNGVYTRMLLSFAAVGKEEMPVSELWDLQKEIFEKSQTTSLDKVIFEYRMKRIAGAEYSNSEVVTRELQ